MNFIPKKQVTTSSTNRNNNGDNANGSGAIVTTRKTRSKINPLSPPTTLQLHGIPIQFPFRPYECQKTYMNMVLNALLKSENALLESPTGTGKTLCLLCATLAWQRQERIAALNQADEISSSLAPTNTTTIRRVPTIIYASRTHSQLSQVVRELRNNTRYRPQVAVLGSREQMCIHPKIIGKSKTTTHQKPSGHDINSHCNALGKERKCRLRNQLEHFTPPPEPETTTTSSCASAKPSTPATPLLDMEELVAFGKHHSICPFYYTRGALETAELIFVPYNYLFDARENTLKDVQWDNAVVIFDEAHNLESFASESSSFTLSSLEIATCIADVSRAISMAQADQDSGSSIKLDRWVKIKEIFLALETYIINLGPQTAYPGHYMFDLFQQSCKITHANYELLLQEIKKMNEWFADVRGKPSHRLEHFSTCLKRVFGHALESRCLAQSAYYRVHVSPPTPQSNNSAGRTISYWCFAPSLAMEELTNLRVRSILVTSGTLSPLPSYQLELGIPFPHTLENPHIIANHQIYTRVIGKGPSGKLLTSSYERRQDADYFTELGNALIGVARVTPDGMLIFFPSYSVMEACIVAWGGPATTKKFDKNRNKKANFFAARKASNSNGNNTAFSFSRCAPGLPRSYTGPPTIWRRLLALKAIVVEPKSSADLPQAMTDFSKFLDEKQGCSLMGVCRGKMSEGIDFAHEQSRAVVITGLPFPPAFDPKVKMKREYLDTAIRSAASPMPGTGKHGAQHGGFAQGNSMGGNNHGAHQKRGNNNTNKLSGHEWYSQQAHRAVNQAIGRVIRNRNDYGAVLLMDNRFGQPANQAGLSKWLRPHVQPDEGFGTLIGTLAGFYRTAQAATTSIMEEERKAQVSVAASVPHDDGEDSDSSLELPSKIALLRKRVDGSSQGESAASFVAKDDVVARLDLHELREQAKKQSSTSATAAAPPKSTPFRQSNEAVFSREAKPMSASKKVAVQFMEKVRSHFPESDQSSIKKAIVAMKAAGDNKNSASYHKLACQVMMIIDKCEPFQECETMESNLLLMFFQLLPLQYRKSVELRGFGIVFERSRLGQALEENLPTNDLTLLKTQVAKLLHSLWCRSSDVPIPRDAYICDCQFLIARLVKEPRARQRVTEFSKLIPRGYRSHTFALFDELEAAHNMKRMKATSNRPREEPLRDSQSSSADHKRKAPQQHQQTSEMAQSQEPGNNKPRKKQLFNPYAKASLRTATTTPVETKPRKPVAVSTTTSLLQQVESEVYRKPTPRNIAQSLKAPRGMVCPICNDCQQPYVAPCGHVACHPCWSSWLQRNPTCMTCRVPTKKDTLARVVEEKEPGRGVPTTLSQLCQDSDSDGELELH